MKRYSYLSALVLPPEQILTARMDVVTQTFVPDSQSPGLLVTVYVPLKSSEDLTQIRLRELLIPAFLGYSILQSKYEVFPLTYQWKHDDANNLWDAVAVTGPEEYKARAQPAATITASPSPAYLDAAPKYVVMYRAILRPFNPPIMIETIDRLLNSARTSLRDTGFANSMFSVNVQGVEPEPKNDFARTFALIATTAAIGTVGLMIAKSTFMRTRP